MFTFYYKNKGFDFKINSMNEQIILHIFAHIYEKGENPFFSKDMIYKQTEWLILHRQTRVENKNIKRMIIYWKKPISEKRNQNSI